MVQDRIIECLPINSKTALCLPNSATHQKPDQRRHPKPDQRRVGYRAIPKNI